MNELIEAIKLQQISHAGMWSDAHQAVIESVIETILAGKAIVPVERINNLERGSLEENLRFVYDALLMSSAHMIHQIEWKAAQDKPDRLLTADEVNFREMGYLEKLKTNHFFRRQAEAFAHIQLDNIRKALNPPSEREKLEAELALKVLTEQLK